MLIKDWQDKAFQQFLLFGGIVGEGICFEQKRKDAIREAGFVTHYFLAVLDTIDSGHEFFVMQMGKIRVENKLKPGSFIHLGEVGEQGHANVAVVGIFVIQQRHKIIPISVKEIRSFKRGLVEDVVAVVIDHDVRMGQYQP